MHPNAFLVQLNSVAKIKNIQLNLDLSPPLTACEWLIETLHWSETNTMRWLMFLNHWKDVEWKMGLNQCVRKGWKLHVFLVFFFVLCDHLNILARKQTGARICGTRHFTKADIVKTRLTFTVSLTLASNQLL